MLYYRSSKKVICFLAGILFQINAIAQIINTYAGGGTLTANGVPANSSAVFPFRPIAQDAAGNKYFFATNIPISGMAGICKVNNSGILTTVAGGGTLTSEGASALNTNVSAACHGLAVDAAGNIYYSEQSTHKVRKISTSGVVTTYVGTGAMGFSGDGGAATSAKLNNPTGICIDASGNLYITDTNNHRIRKVSTSGVITTIAGNGIGGVAGENGPATSANLNMPESVIADATGNIYFCDAGYRVCKVSTSGTLTRIAGTGVIGFSGDGGPALSAQITPKAVAVDHLKNIYIADFLYGVVRRVDVGGVITTIAGKDGLFGYNGDGGNPLNAEIGSPYGLLVDANCNVYITCNTNNVIRVISGTNCYVGINEESLISYEIAVFPNPSTGQFTFDGLTENCSIEVTDLAGRVIYTNQLDESNNSINLQDKQKGLYIYKFKNNHSQVKQGKLILE